MRASMTGALSQALQKECQPQALDIPLALWPCTNHKGGTNDACNC